MSWKRYAEWAARLRVPSGFLLLALYAVFARPVAPWLLAGALVALAGLALRAYAAGHLEKNLRLATSGPYAYTRNPLYLGTALVALGFGLAGGVWWLGFLLALFMLAVYLPVVLEEEAHLAKLFPEFARYAAAVPRFSPRLTRHEEAALGALRPRQGGEEVEAATNAQGRFRWTLYRKNQEYNALLGYLFAIALLVWKLR